MGGNNAARERIFQGTAAYCSKQGNKRCLAITIGPAKTVLIARYTTRIRMHKALLIRHHLSIAIYLEIIQPCSNYCALTVVPGFY